MSRQFSATLLLTRDWPLDIEVLGVEVSRVYPQIGEIEAVPGQGSGRDSGLLQIDDAHVVITSSSQRFSDDALSPDLKIRLPWDMDDAVAQHRAHITISCGGGLAGIEGAKAYAAAVHLVAAAVARITPCCAVFWHRGYVLSPTEAFREGADALLRGKFPMDMWVSYATIVPRGFSPDKAMGMVSYGLKPFLGRELELAPRPGDPRGAYIDISTVAREAMAEEISLADRLRLDRIDDVSPLTVRERTYWLRRDQSAFVLVGDDSVIDRETLRPRLRPAA